MRKIFAFLFFIVTQLCLSQLAFTSPITQHFPTGELELINRVIHINGEAVIAESESIIGKTVV